MKGNIWIYLGIILLVLIVFFNPIQGELVTQQPQQFNVDAWFQDLINQLKCLFSSEQCLSPFVFNPYNISFDKFQQVCLNSSNNLYCMGGVNLEGVNCYVLEKYPKISLLANGTSLCSSIRASTSYSYLLIINNNRILNEYNLIWTGCGSRANMEWQEACLICDNC